MTRATLSGLLPRTAIGSRAFMTRCGASLTSTSSTSPQPWQKVNLAVSNPCFELWLLLHHTDCRSHCAGYDDVVRRLKKHVPAYDKARLRFDDYAGRVFDATKRAKDLDPTGASHDLNPSTSVWRLVEKIAEQS